MEDLIKKRILYLVLASLLILFGYNCVYKPIKKRMPKTLVRDVFPVDKNNMITITEKKIYKEKSKYFIKLINLKKGELWKIPYPGHYDRRDSGKYVRIANYFIKKSDNDILSIAFTGANKAKDTSCVQLLIDYKKGKIFHEIPMSWNNYGENLLSISDDDTIYHCNNQSKNQKSKITAIERETGKIKWKQTFDCYDFSRPVITDKYLILTDDRYLRSNIKRNITLYLINKSNGQVKKTKCGYYVVGNEYIFFNKLKGNQIEFYKLNLNDFKKKLFFRIKNSQHTRNYIFALYKDTLICQAVDNGLKLKFISTLDGSLTGEIDLKDYFLNFGKFYQIINSSPEHCSFYNIKDRYLPVILKNNDNDVLFVNKDNSLTNYKLAVIDLENKKIKTESNPLYLSLSGLGIFGMEDLFYKENKYYIFIPVPENNLTSYAILTFNGEKGNFNNCFQLIKKNSNNESIVFKERSFYRLNPSGVSLGNIFFRSQGEVYVFNVNSREMIYGNKRKIKYKDLSDKFKDFYGISIYRK